MQIFKRKKCEHDWHPKNAAIDICRKCEKEILCGIWKDGVWKQANTFWKKLKWFYYVKIKYREP